MPLQKPNVRCGVQMPATRYLNESGTSAMTDYGAPERRPARAALVLQSCLAFALLFLCSCSSSIMNPIRVSDYQTPIRLACVGDSITFGFGIKARESNSYPAQLQRLLGSRWNVANFGTNGATLLRQGTKPYSLTVMYRDALSFKPDIAVIELGTNDTNPKAWPHNGDFVADYLDLIRTFRQLESKPRIYLCLPVPLFRDRGKAYDTDRIMTEEVIPKIREVARKAHVPVIDLYTELGGKAELFPDGVHPDARGAQVMAGAIARSLVGSPAAHPLQGIK